MSQERVALVEFGESARVVSFEGSRKRDVLPRVLDAYRDVITPDSSVLIQVRNEEWGEYIDVKDDQEIPDRSKLRIRVIERHLLVHISLYL